MKKEEMKNLVVNYGEENENGIFELTEKSFERFKNELPDELKIVKFKSRENFYGIRNNKTGSKPLVEFEIVEETINQNEKPFGTHKAKGDSYIVRFKKKDEEKENVITDMTTCSEIKAWLKTISKKQMEYLRIYNSNGVECRRSAWVG